MAPVADAVAAPAVSLETHPFPALLSPAHPSARIFTLGLYSQSSLLCLRTRGAGVLETNSPESCPNQ